MMSSAEIFITILKEKSLVPDALLTKIQQQVEQKQSAGKNISARDVGTVLIRQEYLTERQLGILLQEVAKQQKNNLSSEDELDLATQEDNTEKKPVPQKSAKNAASISEISLDAESDEIGLAILEDETPKKSTSDKKEKKSSASSFPETKKSVSDKTKTSVRHTSPSSLSDDFGLEDTPATGGLSTLDNILDEDPLNTDAPLLQPVSPKKKGLFGKKTNLGTQKNTAPKTQKVPAKEIEPKIDGGTKSTKKNGKTSSRKISSKKASDNPWDSKLMLLGGGGLLLLVLMAIGLFVSLTWQNADDLFKLAEEDYSKGAYTQAIEKYDKFIKNHPKHISISRAKVHRGLADLRRNVDGTSNYSHALTEAKRVIEEIRSEKDFGEASADLGALLPRISEELAKSALESLSSKTIEEAQESVTLTEKYAPKERDSVRMNDTRSYIALAIRNASRDQELTKTQSLITEKLKAADTAGAYTLRTALVRQYPDLSNDPRLLHSTLRIAEKERKTLHYVSENIPPTEEQTEITDHIFTAQNVVLAEPATIKKTSKNLKNFTRIIDISGTIYALDASTGTVLWSHLLKGKPDTRMPTFSALRITDTQNKDSERGLLLLDRANQKIDYISDEKLLWSQKIPGIIDAGAVLADTEILLATREGKLLTVQRETGQQTGFYSFQQALRLSPAWDAKTNTIYQIAEHSNMFAINHAKRDQAPCTRVYHLQHQPGEILIPPVIVGDYILVGITREGNTTIKVFPLAAPDAEYSLLPDNPEQEVKIEKNTDTQKQNAEETESSLLAKIQPLQEFQITGTVDTLPQVLENRVLIVSDTGEIQIWNISAADARRPFQLLAKEFSRDTRLAGEAAKENRSGKLIPVSCFSLLNPTEVFVGGTQLDRFNIQATQNRLHLQWTRNPNSVTLQPLSWLPAMKAVMHVRKINHAAGVNVCSMDAATGEPQWNVQLAVPLVTAPVILDDKKILALTRLGAIFDVTSPFTTTQNTDNSPITHDFILQKTVAQVPKEYVPEQISQGLCDEKGNVVMVPSGNTTQLLVYVPKNKKFICNPVPDTISGKLLPFRTALLVPGKSGQIFLVDRNLGTVRATFQPKLEGENFSWKLAQIGEKASWLAADNHGRIYRFSLTRSEEQKTPAFVEEVFVEMESPVSSEIILHENTAYFLTEDSIFYAVDTAKEKLEPVKITEFQEKITAGPWIFQDTFIAVKETGDMFAWDKNGEIHWNIKLPGNNEKKNTQLSGTPLIYQQTLLATTIDGTIFTMNISTGEIQTKQNFDYAFSTAPVLWNGKFLVGTQDGSIIMLSKTESTEK
ncbi:MAG: PQQ-binding-like beta-propeller repeat protein [Planctomycetia bacterium]|nr:PQQ-binding-like beta-propeller repeat protein [Planctomycetia bacterium]